MAIRKRLGDRLRRMLGETLVPTRDDLLFIAEWPVLRLAATIMPERSWSGIATRVENAKLLLGRCSPGVSAEKIRRALSLTDDAEARNIALRLAACRTEHFIQVFKSMSGGWSPEIQIEGREHLDAAVARGKGTILWQAPFHFTYLVTKIGLKAAGYPMIHTGLTTHGFCYGPFATRFLNPPLIRAENQYLSKRVIIDSRNPGAALLQVQRDLANNGVVSINVAALAGRNVVRAPLLGGWLPIAVGPPGLAYRTGAALLPVFTTRAAGSRAFSIRIGAPLPMGAGDSATAIRDSVAALVTHLEAAIRSAPEQWHAWEYLVFDEPAASDPDPDSTPRIPSKSERT